ncbi:MAG: hypothetical protein U0I48_06455, partial [Acutalibacteraceae bacterium]|nr:hypothetical protein [Acutalibacteraceae bacterium]
FLEFRLSSLCEYCFRFPTQSITGFFTMIALFNFQGPVLPYPALRLAFGRISLPCDKLSAFATALVIIHLPNAVVKAFFIFSQ